MGWEERTGWWQIMRRGERNRELQRSQPRHMADDKMCNNSSLPSQVSNRTSLGKLEGSERELACLTGIQRGDIIMLPGTYGKPEV